MQTVGPRSTRRLLLPFLGALLLTSLAWNPGPAPAGDEAPGTKPRGETASAIFAGGCFWCMEKPFDQLPGVVSTTSGYTGGQLADPTYEQVSSGNTGHLEAVRVEYDPNEISYETLLDVFWRNIDPLDARGQFCDKGHQYTSAIFYQGEAQKKAAEASKRALEESGRLPAPIVTPVLPAATFYNAEEYHQDYYRKNPLRYRYYRYGCGRDARLTELWGDEAGGVPAAAKEKPKAAP